MRRTLLLLFLTGAVIATTATAAVPTQGSRTWAAALSSKSAVPPAKGAAGAIGTFSATGSFTCKQNEQNCGTKPGKMKWVLTFRGLTGQALLAHIHVGKAGVSGPVLISLCAPCASGAHGTLTVTRAQFAKIGNGAYVNVHTKRNPLGEIRGQLKLSAIL